MGRVGYVCMLASKKGGTLYTGVTSDLARRVNLNEESNPDWNEGAFGASGVWSGGLWNGSL